MAALGVDEIKTLGLFFRPDGDVEALPRTLLIIDGDIADWPFTDGPPPRLFCDMATYDEVNKELRQLALVTLNKTGWLGIPTPREVPSDYVVTFLSMLPMAQQHGILNHSEVPTKVARSLHRALNVQASQISTT
jgi:hypothetical protein